MQRDFIGKFAATRILLRELEGYSIAQLSKATSLKQSALKADSLSRAHGK
jgi:hypothetical protein